MKEECGNEPCRYELAFSIQAQHLRDDLNELKERVSRLENVLGRGVMLLVANLAAVLITLAEQLLR